jgi:hypothetical protein
MILDEPIKPRLGTAEGALLGPPEEMGTISEKKPVVADPPMPATSPIRTVAPLACWRITDMTITHDDLTRYLFTIGSESVHISSALTKVAIYASFF